MTHDELVRIASAWLRRPFRNATGEGHGACAVVITELTAYTAYGEIPDVLGFNASQSKSILIECKVSLADFRADKKKMFRDPRFPDFGMGDQRYFIAPKGIIPESEIPEGWGFIEVDGDGSTRVKRTSKMWDKCAKAEINILISLLCRLKIQPEGHVAIRAYTDDFNGQKSKNKATVTIQSEAE
jgi:hypothetical protein